MPTYSSRRSSSRRSRSASDGWPVCSARSGFDALVHLRFEETPSGVCCTVRGLQTASHPSRYRRRTAPTCSMPSTRAAPLPLTVALRRRARPRRKTSPRNVIGTAPGGRDRINEGPHQTSGGGLLAGVNGRSCLAERPIGTHQDAHVVIGAVAPPHAHATLGLEAPVLPRMPERVKARDGLGLHPLPRTCHLYEPRHESFRWYVTTRNSRTNSSTYRRTFVGD